MKSDWNYKKSGTVGIICLIVSVLCFIGFLVSAMANQPTKGEKFLNKYEKLCKEGNAVKIAKLYAKEENMTAEDVVIPFDGNNAEFIFEDFEDLGDKNYELSYTVYFETEEEKVVDGEKRNVKIPYSYPGNKINLKKTILGYRIIEE